LRKGLGFLTAKGKLMITITVKVMEGRLETWAKSQRRDLKQRPLRQRIIAAEVMTRRKSPKRAEGGEQ